MWNKLAILVAIVLGFLSVFLVRNYIQKIKDAEIADQVLVCVAKSDIAEGIKINTDHIAYRPMPLKYKPSDSYFWKDRAELLGLISTTKIKARDYFMGNMFTKAEQAGGTSILNIKLGYRAMSLPMSGDAGVSGLCRPGDKVDMVGTFQMEEVDPDNVLSTPTPKTWTMTILPNVQIMALDQNTGKFGEEATNSYGSATFMLTPLECEVLTYMVSKGTKFTYLLRNPSEPDAEVANEPRKITEERIEQQLKDMLRFHNTE